VLLHAGLGECLSSSTGSRTLGSFDCVAVGFANRNFAQDDILDDILESVFLTRRRGGPQRP
jgi:hypothetical protein